MLSVYTRGACGIGCFVFHASDIGEAYRLALRRQRRPDGTVCQGIFAVRATVATCTDCHRFRVLANGAIEEVSL